MYVLSFQLILFYFSTFFLCVSVSLEFCACQNRIIFVDLNQLDKRLMLELHFDIELIPVHIKWIETCAMHH